MILGRGRFYIGADKSIANLGDYHVEQFDFPLIFDEIGRRPTRRERALAAVNRIRYAIADGLRAIARRIEP